MESQIEFAEKNRYVLTMFNRRRYIPEILSENQNIRQFAQRTAINTPIQGTAADMIKIAMISIHEKLKAGNLKSKMILQVHDELVFDVAQGELNQISAIAQKGMEEVVELEIPIMVNVRSGRNWEEA
jgi:DNA polymerase I